MTVVFDAINDFVTQHTAKEVEAVFARHDAVASRVLSVEEIMTNEQIRHRGDIVSVDGARRPVSFVGWDDRLAQTAKAFCVILVLTMSGSLPYVRLGS